jgi:hypothetical protein
VSERSSISMLFFSFLFFSFFLAFSSFLVLNFLCSCSCADDSPKNFDDMGFSFQHPAGWIVNSDSNSHDNEDNEEGNSQASGKLELVGPCVCFSINWTRDPGMSPDTILDQIEKTYDNEEVKVLSAERGEVSMRGERVKGEQMRDERERAKVMSLSYELKGYRSAKRFAVWNSSRSDRLFLASISSSGCSPEQELSTSAANAALFDSLIASFTDREERTQLTLGPKSKDEAWTLVLGDLLSSYHYSQPKTLPARIARVQVLHTLSPINGTYHLDSQEMIRVDLPSDAALRAGSVQSLLLQEGYDARLAQRSGEIGVAVKDSSGRWQLVSVNPAKPEKSVGVLANGTREVLIYENLEELADENRMDIKGLNPDTGNLDTGKLMQKDCEPSRYVELTQPSDIDKSWREDLQKVLENYDYDERYQENVFDCSNTAQICWSVLQGKGYDARLMMSWKGLPLGPHLWVAVPYPYEEGRYVAVETANTDGDMKLVHLGRVVADDDYYRGIMYNSSAQYSRLHPEEGMWLDKKI